MPTIINQTSGLRTLREERMLTQQELASQAGLTVTTVSRIETGKVQPGIRTIRSLAGALDCSPQKLKLILEGGTVEEYITKESSEAHWLGKLGRALFRRK